MHNPYRGGTADVWYSSIRGDLWIEYKYIARVPKKARIVPNLSKLQLDWLGGRIDEGRKVFVVVGHPGGAVIFDRHEWEAGLPPDEFHACTRTRQELADWISA